jgi:hypothetical protein
MSDQPSIPKSFTRLKNLLVTGSPGCGKTTVLKRVAEQLHNRRLTGFITLELRKRGQRLGFEAVGLSGRRFIFACDRFRSLDSVGRYGVELDRLIRLINGVRPVSAETAREIDAFPFRNERQPSRLPGCLLPIQTIPRPRAGIHVVDIPGTRLNPGRRPRAVAIRNTSQKKLNSSTAIHPL